MRFPLSSFDLGLLGCDHVSNAHGGCIVYPIFAILPEACWRSHAASYSYSSLSSFSAKSLFEIHPVVSATIELPPSFLDVSRLPSFSPVLSLRFCHASFLINPWSQLVATGHNWLSASVRHLLPPFASIRHQGPLSLPSPPVIPTFDTLSLPIQLASSIVVSGPIIIHCIRILYPVSSIRSATCSFVPAFLHPLSSSFFHLGQVDSTFSVSSTARSLQ